MIDDNVVVEMTMLDDDDFVAVVTLLGQKPFDVRSDGDRWRCVISGVLLKRRFSIDEHVIDVLDMKKCRLRWKAKDEARLKSDHSLGSQHCFEHRLPQHVEDRIQQLRRIEDGWYIGEGKRPSRGAFMRLRAVLSFLDKTHQDNVHLYPVPDGSVQAEWIAKDDALDAVFGAAGEVSCSSYELVDDIVHNNDVSSEIIASSLNAKLNELFT